MIRELVILLSIESVGACGLTVSRAVPLRRRQAATAPCPLRRVHHALPQKGLQYLPPPSNTSTVVSAAHYSNSNMQLNRISKIRHIFVGVVDTSNTV